VDPLRRQRSIPLFLLLAVLCAAVMAAGAATARATSPATGAPFTSPDGLWTWARPLPHGYPATALAAPSKGTLFATTAVPDILVARGGGATWGWSDTGAVPGFGFGFSGPTDVTFVSAKEGWACGSDAAGDAGVVLHTTNAGATWSPALTTPGRTVLRLRFAGPDDGWVLAGLVGDEGDFVLYVTSDGGSTWSAPRAVPNNGITTFAAFAAQGGQRAVLLELAWSDGASSGEIVGTWAWRTTDGGVTWLPPAKMKGAQVANAAFSSPTRGWATAAHYLWGTTDGGASWHKVRRAPPHAFITTTGTDVWVISQGALHSPDEGVTWQRSPGLSGDLVAFADHRDGWVEASGEYLHTSDGGATWRRLTSAPKPPVGDLAAAHGTVWAAHGRAFRSTDAGGHWTAVTGRLGLQAIAAVSATQAWAVGSRGLIIHTADGGRHWVRQPSGVTADLLDVAFADAGHGWAGGQSGRLLRTVDGGRHWTTTRLGSPPGVRQLSFADDTHGIALLNMLRPDILVTADGGRTWTTVHLPVPTDRPTAVTMEDASHAVLIAYSVTQRISHTWTSSDGGKTWQRGADLSADYYWNMAHLGAQLCAVGSGRVATSANGATWAVDVPSGGDMDGVAFANPSLLMISGDTGVLTRDLKTAPLP
jgi:photosystem II stability/assembly factor-like uncharacterized protein